MPDGTDMPRSERALCADGLTAWHKWFKHAVKKNKTVKGKVETIRLWRLWREHETQLWEASVKPGGFTEEEQLWKAVRVKKKAHVGTVHTVQGPQRRPSILLNKHVCTNDDVDISAVSCTIAGSAMGGWEIAMEIRARQVRLIWLRTAR
jgi:hypothetical protein